jgi:sec-independent protein translocase protein TatA
LATSAPTWARPFKDGVKGDEDKAAPGTPAAPSQVADKTTIDVEAKEKSKQ